MVKYTPTEIDEYFFLDALMIFLMLHFNLPLATIYFAMAILGTVMYYVATDSGFFHPIPFSRKGDSKLMKVGVGIAFGLIFLQFYNYLNVGTPMGAVFATTVFGNSEAVGKFVFGILIPLVESRFFFRTILQMWSWKIKQSLNVSPLSFAGLKIMAFYSALFTAFHWAIKGLTDTPELIAVFVFGMMSVGLVLQFKEMIQAVMAHMVINSIGVGLLTMATLSSPIAIITIVVAYFLFISDRKEIKFGGVSV